MKHVLFVIIILSALQSVKVQDCILGKCKRFVDCPSAKEDLLERGIKPIGCGYIRSDTKVCCVEPDNRRISERKCDQYSGRWIINKIEENKRIKRADAGLALVDTAEAPHMAILGRLNENNETNWDCCGSLISEQFVLTAAHCINSRAFGKVSRVRLGDLDIADDTENASPQEFNVLQTFVHPEFTALSKYHDIAIVKLDKPVNYTIHVRPACLHTTYNITEKKFFATGWGTTEFGGEPKTGLQTVEEDYIPIDTCKVHYKDIYRLKEGLKDEWMICAENEGHEQLCQGSSGGPLHIRILGFPLTFRIVGVTSFGKGCGVAPGVYTRVSNYISWIESIVWPNA